MPRKSKRKGTAYSIVIMLGSKVTKKSFKKSKNKKIRSNSSLSLRIKIIKV